jgi:alanine dehydrogenase
MLIGVPREIKTHEYRVGLVPSSVRELVLRGHEVIVESGAGAGIGLDDASYRAAGAGIVDTAEEVFALAEMIVKVKEPRPVEYGRLREDQILFTYPTSPPTGPRPRGWRARAVSPSPTRPSPTRAAGCRCSRR